MRKFIRAVGLFLARIFGTRVTDFQTGRRLDKALDDPLAWKNSCHRLERKCSPDVSTAEAA